MFEPPPITAHDLARLPEAERRAAFAALAPTPEAAEQLKYCWPFWARPEQLPPPKPWRAFLFAGGRAAGKTRAAGEWVRTLAESGQYPMIALVGETARDTRDIMVEGPSGLMNICPPWDMPSYSPTMRRLTWKNGTEARMYSAEEPGQLRGPQFNAAWPDEIGKWRRAQQETWDNIILSTRLMPNAGIFLTTTPLPTKTFKAIYNDPTTIVRGASTYANRANLAPEFIADIERRYKGTRLERQEVYGELLGDVEGSLFNWDLIEAAFVPAVPPGVRLVRVVVAVDPSGSGKATADEAGIVVAGKGSDGLGYILEDLSLRASPEGWGRVVVDAYHRWDADRVVAEANFGAAMVELVVRVAAARVAREGDGRVTEHVAYKPLWASRGKVPRAEPVAALYEQHRVKHVGKFDALEREMCEWVPGMPSPGRLDAAVWGLSELLLGPSGPRIEPALVGQRAQLQGHVDFLRGY